MQIIGEVGSNGIGSETKAHDTAGDSNGLTRGRFIKGALGAAAAVSVLSGAGVLASPASAREKGPFKSIGHRDIGGEELGRIARSVAGRKDVANVTGSSWSRKVGTARNVKRQVNGHDIEVLANGGNPSVRASDGGVSVNGGGIVVKAAKHDLGGDNRLLAVVYMASNRIVAYYEFDEPTGGVKSKAEIWEVDQENDAVVLKSASSNGVLDSPIPRSESESSSTARIYCGGCRSSRRRRKVTVCSNVSWSCLIIYCGVCLITAPSWTKLLCVYVYCPYLLYPNTGSCCKPGGTRQACAGCPR